MTYIEFLRAVLNGAVIVSNGETHPAAEIYSPETLDRSSHVLMWEEWRIHRMEPSELSQHVTANGETWTVTL